jgi:hypothetical protein
LGCCGCLGGFGSILPKILSPESVFSSVLSRIAVFGGGGVGCIGGGTTTGGALGFTGAATTMLGAGGGTGAAVRTTGGGTTTTTTGTTTGGGGVTSTTGLGGATKIGSIGFTSFLGSSGGKEDSSLKIGFLISGLLRDGIAVAVTLGVTVSLRRPPVREPMTNWSACPFIRIDF